MADPTDFSNGVGLVPDGNGPVDSNMAPSQDLSSQGISAGQSDELTISSSLTASDEIALYDRQIRLWGMQAQERLRTANILLVGMGALGNEIAKNLVLAGIGSLTIVDDMTVTEDDLGAQFFISAENIGQIRSRAALPQIQRLNPRVALYESALPPLLDTPTFFGAYNLVIATDLPFTILNHINMSTRLVNRPLYIAGSFGIYGFIFADLITHSFVINREKSNIETKIGQQSATQSIIGVTSSRGSDGKTTESVTKQETYTPINLANTSPLPQWHLSTRRRRFNVSPILSLIRALWEYQSKPETAAKGSLFPATSQELGIFTLLAREKHQELQLPSETLRGDILKSFVGHLGSELSPVCAYIGGQLAQDAINVIGGKEQPIQNFMIFDGEDTKANVYALHTEMPDLGEPLGNGVSAALMAGVGGVDGAVAPIPGVMGEVGLNGNGTVTGTALGTGAGAASGEAGMDLPTGDVGVAGNGSGNGVGPMEVDANETDAAEIGKAFTTASNEATLMPEAGSPGHGHRRAGSNGSGIPVPV